MLPKPIAKEVLKVYTFGRYFLAMAGLVKRLNKESHVLVHEVDSFEDFSNKISETLEGIFVCHIGTHEELISFLNLIKIKKNEFVSNKKKMIFVTNRISPVNMIKFKKYKFLNIVDSTVEAYDLYALVLNSYNQIRPEIIWTPSQFKGTHSVETKKASHSSFNIKELRNTHDKIIEKFSPITNSKRIAANLRESLKFKNKTSIWSKKQSKTIDIIISLVDENVSIFYIEPANPSISLADEIGNWVTYEKDLYFSSNLRRSRIFFISKMVLPPGNRMIRFSLPKEIYEVQRRNQFRLPIDPNKNMLVNFFNPKANKIFNYQIDNLSAKGLAILVEDSDVEYFDVGSDILDLNFELPEISIKIKNAEIRHVTKLNHDHEKKYTRIGFYLKSISANQASLIEFYVYHESMGYLKASSE